MKHWKKVLSVLLFALFCGFYLIKTTHSATYSSVQQHESIHAVPTADEGELSLLTYNVAGLPEFISSAASPRAYSIREISRKINRFDIVNVQEDFHYHQELYSAENRHPYRTTQKVSIPYGDGLNTLSKYPIRETRRIPWKDCNGSDCLAAKGFSLTRIEIAKDVLIDIYNIHATAQDDAPAAEARQKNIVQLADYIERHSAGNALFVMGDFNAHFGAEWDNLKELTTRTGLQDVWSNLMNQGQYPVPKPDFIVADKLSLTEHSESIDKILFRNSADLEFSPLQYQVEKQYFVNETGTPLSDHYAISSKIAWKRTAQRQLAKH